MALHQIKINSLCALALTKKQSITKSKNMRKNQMATKDNNTTVNTMVDGKEVMTHQTYLDTNAQEQMNKVIEMRERAGSKNFGLLSAVVIEKGISPDGVMNKGTPEERSYTGKPFVKVSYLGGTEHFKNIPVSFLDMVEDDALTKYDFRYRLAEKYGKSEKVLTAIESPYANLDFSTPATAQ
jgi:hypothetical protein